MNLLPCKCGTKFRIKPELAGKVVMTPCCNSRIRVPANSSAEQPSKPKRVRVKCSCGQVMALNRPKGPVEIKCPSCQKKMRLGAPAVQPVVVAELVSEPVSDDFWDQPVSGSMPLHYNSNQLGRSRAKTGRRKTKKKAKKRTRKKSKTRIPRIGIFKDEFGFTALVIAGCVMFGVFAALGTYLSTQASANMAKAAASADWKAADGQIIQSGFEVRGIRRSRQAATVSVQYRYRVGDSPYIGNLLSFEKQDSFRPATAEEILKPYPSGAKCKVYYDPDDPSKSVLIKGIRSGNTINLVVGLLMILGGVVMAIDCWIGAANVRGS